VIEALKKLRAATPEWYDRYVAAFEAEYARRLDKLLSCPAAELQREQGICAFYAHNLELLKQIQ